MRLVDVAGLNTRFIDSTWRKNRLLIICWHGVSNDDEHVWNPSLFMAPEIFQARLQLLRAMKCNVLTLSEALFRLKTASLPPRATCLTVDDGDSSFYLRAWPLLRGFAFPATLYWTTYYSIHPCAVFDPMLSYLLWKGRAKTLQLREPEFRTTLRTAHERSRAFAVIYGSATRMKWTADDKEAFLIELARLLEIDYSQIQARRILHLITPAEAQAMASDGLDLQLHTHHHRVPRRREEFNAELTENIGVLRDAGVDSPKHFCYPSGSFLPEFAPWLRDNGIESATTCKSGLAERDTDPFFLPRLMDHQGISSAEFSGWLSGIATTFSRNRRMSEHSFR